MVAHSESAGDSCVPGPTPSEIYQPGDVVRLRVFRGLAMLAAQPNITVAPDTYVIAGVVYEKTLHGQSALYRLLNSGGSFLVDPANVIRVEPPRPERADEFCACDLHAAHIPSPVSFAALESRICWQQSSPVGDAQSEDGRFTLMPCVGKSFTARDGWTEEEAPGLSNREAAAAWCEARVKGTPLHFATGPGYRVAACARGEFRVHTAADGRFFGSDTRFDGAHELRQSPWFHTRESAELWCCVRAACVVEGDPESDSARLRYAPDLPF